jgi:hypothetical protein
MSVIFWIAAAVFFVHLGSLSTPNCFIRSAFSHHFIADHLMFPALSALASI